METEVKLIRSAAPPWLKAFIGPASAVMGCCLIVQILIVLVFSLCARALIQEYNGLWQVIGAPFTFTGLMFLSINIFPKEERKGAIFVGCLTVVSGLFMLDIFIMPDSVVVFEISILALTGLWFTGYLYNLLVYASPTYIRANMVSSLPRDLKTSALEAINAYKDIEQSLAKAPEEYRRETHGLLHQVEELVDKLLVSYPLIASLEGYRSQAMQDDEAKIADSAFSRSSEVLEKLYEKTSRILGLLHEVQGWVLILLAGTCDLDDPNTSPVMKVKKISDDLALQAAALDEINERLGEK